MGHQTNWAIQVMVYRLSEYIRKIRMYKRGPLGSFEPEPGEIIATRRAHGRTTDAAAAVAPQSTRPAVAFPVSLDQFAPDSHDQGQREWHKFTGKAMVTIFSSTNLMAILLASCR